MNLFPNRSRGGVGPMQGASGTVVKKKAWVKWALTGGAVVLVVGGAFLWKTGSVLNKISSSGNIFSSLAKSLPGVNKTLKGEETGRINIALLGMRGEHMDGGGLLADTIMVMSIHPSKGEGDQPKVSLVSVPRDLYVTMPGTSDQMKINAVHALNEEKGKGQGMKGMEAILSEVTGVPIDYAISISFKGFTDLVNAVGGIDVTLKEPFNESVQFRQPHVCDPYVFNVPTSPQQFENKYHVRQDGTRYVAKSYPLCYNKDVECGGMFELPAGVNHLAGDRALCFARARYTSNDFERARRQQLVLQSLKEKALSAGTLTDFGKVNAIIDALGDNVRTDMEGWELKQLFEIYQKMGNAPQLTQKVLEDSEEGLLHAPEATKETGYILLPRGDNYDRIHALFNSLP
ncbi:MAG: LCP family protein [Candidatus Moranbacteria bacterium]|nr:LCP family protein [Candidatus Moranbacteria bacterium]